MTALVHIISHSFAPLAAVLALFILYPSSLTLRAAQPPKPNLIFVYADNLGYGDIGCFGHPTHHTPRLDRMAEEGMKLTHFYSTSGVCTPSRASLMTGCYPRRVGLDFPDPDGAVLRPISPNGLHPDEITIAEVLKAAGYETMIIGKWHLGDQPVFLPTRQGFDHFLGIPYSDNAHKRENRPHWPELPLMRNEEVIDQPVDPAYLTKRYTEAAIRFISKFSPTKYRAQPTNSTGNRQPATGNRERGDAAKTFFPLPPSGHARLHDRTPRKSRLQREI
jgi:arylsulfatase A